MRYTVGHATDMGRVRERNEDSVLVHPPLYVVADGMGGHRGGDVASQIALETMERLESEGGSLADHVRRANRAVWDRSAEDQRLTGMGTTLTAARLDGSSALLAHVGDSRAYLMRDGALRQLTDDHTLVARMVRSGEITEAEAEVHPHKNVLTRALGTDEDVEVDEESIDLRGGDRVLLCSDGLTGMVTEEQIQAIIETSPDPQRAANQLVRAANRAGGVDNITVVVIQAIDDTGGTAAPKPRIAGPSRPTLRRWGLWAGLGLLVLAVALFGARWYLDRQWYVGPSDGNVTVFRGIPLAILGYELGSPVVTPRTDLSAEDVRQLQQWSAFDEGIAVEGREEALALIDQMAEDVRALREAERRQERNQEGGGG